jgi:hypothetical protein
MPARKGLISITENENTGAISSNGKTQYPSQYITPKDKISNLAFTGELSSNAQLKEIAMERKGSKKRITTLARVDFENLGGIEIRGSAELSAYDREVHDAIATLYVEGGNEFITPRMIYQVMSGDPNACLNPKQFASISASVDKLRRSRVVIRADEEANAYGLKKFSFDGNLIAADRITATLNGTDVECLRILRVPILYEYADKKNQVGRLDIKLLNSPVSKNEESIVLQGYLFRRILSMQGGNLSKTILYETIYSQLDISSASEGALRKKKAIVRKKAKEILEYWKTMDFISGYTENARKTVMYSISLQLPPEKNSRHIHAQT